jgi:hypothetical protein
MREKTAVAKKGKSIRVIVEVKSGIVQEIKASTKDISIVVLDLDIIHEDRQATTSKKLLIREYDNLPYIVW